jgi:hypothetical protein
MCVCVCVCVRVCFVCVFAYPGHEDGSASIWDLRFRV